MQSYAGAAPVHAAMEGGRMEDKKLKVFLYKTLRLLNTKDKQKSKMEERREGRKKGRKKTVLLKDIGVTEFKQQQKN